MPKPSIFELRERAAKQAQQAPIEDYASIYATAQTHLANNEFKQALQRLFHTAIRGYEPALLELIKQLQREPVKTALLSCNSTQYKALIDFLRKISDMREEIRDRLWTLIVVPAEIAATFPQNPSFNEQIFHIARFFRTNLLAFDEKLHPQLKEAADSGHAFSAANAEATFKLK